MSGSGMEALYRRIASAFGSGRVATTQDAVGQGARLLQLRLSEEETRDGTPDIAHYGFSSRPRPGADAVMIFLEGDRSGGIVIATNDRRVRLVLSEGEVALHTDEGDAVHLRRGNQVEIRTQTLRVIAATAIIQGDLYVTGQVTADGDVVASGVSAKTHEHGGVQPGAGISGQPL